MPQKKLDGGVKEMVTKKMSTEFTQLSSATHSETLVGSSKVDEFWLLVVGRVINENNASTRHPRQLEQYDYFLEAKRAEV